MCLGKYLTFSNKLSLRLDKLVDPRIISGWLNKSPVRLFPEQWAGILLFLYIGSQIFMSGSRMWISEVIESKYRRRKPFPQNSVRMANFPVYSLVALLPILWDFYPTYGRVIVLWTRWLENWWHTFPWIMGTWVWCNIMKTRLYNFDPIKKSFFLFLLKNIDCGYSYGLISILITLFYK